MQPARGYYIPTAVLLATTAARARAESRAMSDADPQSIARSLREVAPLVLRLCRGVLAGPDAEDAAQESLIALARALPGFRSECSLATFATRITMRTAIRARARQRSTVELPDDAAGHGPSAELRAIVGSLVDRLTPEQAEAFVLRYVVGQSLAEIAEVASAPINTVRSRIRLAREALRRELAAHPKWSGLTVDDD